MKRSTLSLWIVYGCVWLSGVAFAQQTSKEKSSSPLVATTPASQAAATPVQASEAVVVPSYRYEAKGRRDPFRSLDVTSSVQATNVPIIRPPGLKGQLVSEINVVGIVKSKGEYMAVATGYRGKTHFIHPNDELYDGRIVEIRSDAVVFNQILTDNQGKKLSQQVVKKLYPTRGEGNDAK